MNTCPDCHTALLNDQRACPRCGRPYSHWDTIRTRNRLSTIWPALVFLAVLLAYLAYVGYQYEFPINVAHP